MLLRGPFAGPIQQVPLRSAPGVHLAHDQAGRVDIEAVAEWLRNRSGSLAAGVRTNALAVGRGLNLWLALHDGRFCALTVEASAAASGEQSFVPYLYARGPIRTSVGLPPSTPSPSSFNQSAKSASGSAAISASMNDVAISVGS